MNERIKKPGTLLEGVPNIGGDIRDKQLIKDAIDEFVKVLDPIMNRMGQAISELQGRLTQTEEIVNGALVEILAERVAKKIMGHGYENYKDTHQYENEPDPPSSLGTEKKSTEDKAWDGELKHEDTEAKPKKVILT